MKDNRILRWCAVGLGLIAVIWVSVLLAPTIGGGLPSMLPKLGEAFSHPLRLSWCERTPACMLILTAIYGFSLLIYHYTKPNYRRRVEHGSAEWGEAQKISKKYSQSPREMNKILTQNVEIGYDAHKHRRNLNTLVVGGSGAGKTRFYAKPNIMQGNTSFVVLDPKGEILRDTGKLLEAKGYEVRVLDLINMEKSMCYNPLLYAESDNDVQRLVTNLFKATTPKGSQSQDPFWDTAASMLLMALIFYVKAKAYPNQQTFGKVLELLAAGEVNEEDSNQQSILDEMFGDLAEEYPGHIALKYYTAYRGGAAKTLKSIQITLQARLEKFNLESLNLLCSADELDLKALGTKKVALFALIPDNDTSFNFLVSMLYTQLFQQLFKVADSGGGALPVPVHFMMDEFANVSLPDDFDKILSVMRSRGVSVSIILQNLAQLKALFEKQWESIVGNCDEFLYLGGNEQSTHKYVSELLGKATIDTNTYCPLEGTLEIPASCKKIGSNAFGHIETITTLILHEGLEEIGAEAFLSSSIKRIITVGKNDSDETVQTFPDSLKSIGAQAFRNSSLTGTLLIDSTNLSALGDYAFAYTDSLEKLIVRNTAFTVLKEKTFCGKMLEEVDLSESAITRIEMDNFGISTSGSVNALKTIRFPAGLTYIGYDAMRGFDCSDMVLPAGLLQYRAGTTGHLTLPESVIGINPDIFREHTIITFLNKDKEIRSYNGEREWDSALPTSISKNCLIRCYKDSFIHKWCVENNITYELIDGDGTKLCVELKAPDGTPILSESIGTIRWFDRTTGKEVCLGADSYILPDASIGHMIECKMTFSRDMIDRYMLPESITFLFDTSKEDFAQARSMVLISRSKITLKGKVAQFGVEGLTVTLVNRLTGYSKTVTLNADGSFIIPDLPRVDGYELILDMADTVERIYEKETVGNFIFRKVGSDGVIDLGTLTMQDAGILTRIPVTGDTNIIGRVKLVRLSDGKEFSATYDNWSGMLIISDKDNLLRRGDVVKLIPVYSNILSTVFDTVTFTIPGKYADPSPLTITKKNLGKVVVRPDNTSVYLYDADGIFVQRTTYYAYLLPGTYTAIAVDSRIRLSTYGTLTELRNSVPADARIEQTISIAYGDTFEWETQAKEACRIASKSGNAYLMIFGNDKLVGTVDANGSYYVYVVSPYSLAWNGDNYYLIGFSEKHGAISNFRIDRMTNLKLMEEEAVPLPEGFSVSEYCAKLFLMVGGKQETVEILCDNAVMNNIIRTDGVRESPSNHHRNTKFSEGDLQQHSLKRC